MKTYQQVFMVLIGTISGMAFAMDAMDASTMTKEQKIQNAMSAAPAAIASGATIMDFPAMEGKAPVQLRHGANGWTCFPDMPNTPGNDPMCLDKTWMIWMNAYMHKTKPVIKHAGLAYMLQGGSDADNDDPFATQPAAGKSWIQAPPHIMVLSPDRLDSNVYSKVMNGSAPWIMFGGTPYEHLMIPVK